MKAANDVRGVCCNCQQQDLNLREATYEELVADCRERGYDTVKQLLQNEPESAYRLVGHDAYGTECDGKDTVPQAFYDA